MTTWCLLSVQHCFLFSSAVLYAHSHARYPKWLWWLFMPQLLTLIAENFMTGYRVVFDREKLVLGWKKFDCQCFFSSHGYCALVFIVLYTYWNFVLKQVTTLRIITMPFQQDHTHMQMCLLLSLQGLVITLPLIQLENPNTTLRGQLHHHLHIIAILHFQLSSDFLYCVLFIFYNHSFVRASGSLW